MAKLDSLTLRLRREVAKLTPSEREAWLLEHIARQAEVIRDQKIRLDDRKQRLEHAEAMELGYQRRIANLGGRFGKPTSTRRLQDGVVHEMAERGVRTMCGEDLREPWTWTDKRLTCTTCKQASLSLLL